MIYPPITAIIDTKGPIDANVYCPNPPLTGINPLSSAKEKDTKIFNPQAIAKAMIKPLPAKPTPCDNVTKQLVATIRPIPAETALDNPNF